MKAARGRDGLSRAALGSGMGSQSLGCQGHLGLFFLYCDMAVEYFLIPNRAQMAHASSGLPSGL